VATSGELERVAALVKRLTPLTGAARGEPIRADHWNLVVGALVELARATLTGNAAGGAAPHDHADQVKLGWLEPSLRTLIERGPLADPVKTAELADIGRTVGRLAERVHAVEGSVTLVRDRVAEVVTHDLTRAADVRDVRRVVDGMADAREDVADLRGTLDIVRKDVAIAVAAARQLTVDGQPLDVSALLARMVSLESARDRLRLPNGELLDATGLEQRLARLVEELVTEEELKDALDARPAQLSQEERAALERSLALAVSGTIDDRTHTVAEALRAELTLRLAEVDGQIANVLAATLPGAIDAAAVRFRDEVLATVKNMVDALVVQLGRTVEELRAELIALIEQRIKDLWTVLPKMVATEVAAAVEAALAEPLKRLAELEKRVADLEGRTKVLEDGQRAFEVQTAARFRDVVADRAALEQKLLAEMVRREDELARRLERQHAAIEKALRDRLDALAAERLTALTRDLERLAATAANREAAVLAAKLRGEMRDIARDEVQAALRIRPR